ncbi:Uncharacterized protein Rs2_03220 [Raphanus sativus]|nr:Uncharacterized protein Rs2_03220 [Raphanus sativus]
MSFSSSSSSGSLKGPTFKEEDEEQEEKLRQVLKYHNQTKHSFTGYARGPRGLDWANQPNPFRRYLSSPLLPLQHSSGHHSVLYSSLFDSSLPPPKPISLSVGLFQAHVQLYLVRLVRYCPLWARRQSPHGFVSGTPSQKASN